MSGAPCLFGRAGDARCLRPPAGALLDDNGHDDEARAAARQILAFFNRPGRSHHADEEARVLPELVASGDPQLIAHVRRLHEDHRGIEEDWRMLAPQIEAIAGAKQAAGRVAG